MVIRNSQMQAFRNAMKLPERIRRLLRTRQSEVVKALDDATLLRRIEIGMVRASQYGFTSDTSIAAFVTLMFIVGPAFDEHPRIQRLLKDETTALERRMDLLGYRVSGAEWEAAGKSGGWPNEP
jgi:hypothetical protein